MDIQLIVHVPDSILPQAENIKKIINQFALEEVEKALEQEKQIAKASKLSKWGKLAKNEPACLNGTSEHVLLSSQEIREDFSFGHDLDDLKE